MERPMLVESDIHIRAYEIDSMGIVSNIVYVKWFEDLRHILLDKYYPYSEMMKDKKSPMLIKTEIEYKKPLTIMDKPVGRLWFTKLGRTKWELSLEISVGDTIYCQGKQTGCFYDIENNSVASFPEWFIEKFNTELKK